MATSFAELDFRVLTGLGTLPAELCDLKDAHNAVVQRVGMRTNQVRQADTNIRLSKSSEFYINSTEPQNISSYLGNGDVSFVEYFNGNNFELVKVVNLTLIADFINSGELVCALYSDESNQTYIQFSIAPIGAVRVWFDANSLQKNMNSNASAIPDVLGELVVLEAQNYLIPRIKLKITMSIKRLFDMGFDTKGMIAALDSLYAQNLGDIGMYEGQFNVHAYRDRGTQGKTKRRIPRGRDLYGG